MAQRTIASYEWASVAQYIAYIEQVLMLTQVSGDEVHSFRITKVGPGRLLSRKRRLVDILDKNNSRLCSYVGNSEVKIEEDELIVLRGVYRSNCEAISVMRGHIERLEEMKINQAKLDIKEEANGELPF